MSEFSSKALPQAVEQYVGGLSEKDEINIDDSLIKSFNEVENNYVNSVKEAFKLGFGEVAKVGNKDVVP